MAFSDFFKPRSVIDAQNTAQTTAANTNASANQQPGASPVPATPPVSDKIPGSVQTPPNPLDVYSKMLENASNASPDQAPIFAIDGKTLNEVAATMDFTAGIPKEVMEKAMTGDVASMMEVIQYSGRGAYKAALDHQSKLTDAHLNQRSIHDDKKIDRSVKAGLVNNSLASVANYSHPVAKAELNRVATAYQRDNPDASPQQVAEAAHKYITDLASALNPVVAGTGKDANGEPLEMDWSSYLTK